MQMVKLNQKHGLQLIHNLHQPKSVCALKIYAAIANVIVLVQEHRRIEQDMAIVSFDQK